MNKTVKLISCIAHSGEILQPGKLLDLDEEAADDLIRRGRAVLATEEEKEQAAQAAEPDQAAPKVKAKA